MKACRARFCCALSGDVLLLPCARQWTGVRLAGGVFPAAAPAKLCCGELDRGGGQVDQADGHLKVAKKVLHVASRDFEGTAVGCLAMGQVQPKVWMSG